MLTVLRTVYLHYLCSVYSLSNRLDPSNPPLTLHEMINLDVSKAPFADGGVSAHNLAQGGQVKAAVLSQLQFGEAGRQSQRTRWLENKTRSMSWSSRRRG